MNKTQAKIAARNECEQIIFQQTFEPEDYEKNLWKRKFKSITYATIQKLIEKGFLKLEDDDYLYSSPTPAEIIEFVEKHNPDNWYFHGYVELCKYNEFAVVIEGIGSHKPLDINDLVDFVQYFRYADDLEIEVNKPVYCWID